MTTDGWNFETFEKFINQRFDGLSLQLLERHEAQQASISAAFVAAEKAVNATRVAAEKAVDKAEYAQQLRNESQNEFRNSLGDLSALMWTSKEGNEKVDGLRRELTLSINTNSKKVEEAVQHRTEGMEALRKALETRISLLENGYANLQGRIWGVSALFATAALVIDVAFRYAISH